MGIVKVFKEDQIYIDNCAIEINKIIIIIKT